MSIWTLIILLFVSGLICLVLIGIFIYQRIRHKKWNLKLLFGFAVSLCASILLLFIFFVKVIKLGGDTWENLNRDIAQREAIEKKNRIAFLAELKKMEPKQYKNKVLDDYYSYHGAWDFWRFPTVYPYSITCIDTRNYGTLHNDIGITNYREGGSLTPASDYFNEFVFDKQIMICKKHKSPFDADSIKTEGYFVLEFSTGEIFHANTLAEAYKRAIELHYIGDTILTSIKDYSNKL